MAFNSKLNSVLKNSTLNANATNSVPRGLDKIEDGNGEVRAVAIAVTASVAFLLVLLCGTLTYRQLKRRRLETGYFQEVARREVIRKTIKQKIEQLTKLHAEDSTSHLELMALKVPLVTFGNVTKIITKSYPFELEGQQKRKSSKRKLLHFKDYNGDSSEKFLHPDKTDGHLHCRRAEKVENDLLYDSYNNDLTQGDFLQNKNVNGLVSKLINSGSDNFAPKSLQAEKYDELSGENFSNEDSLNICPNDENAKAHLHIQNSSENIQQLNLQVDKSQSHELNAEGVDIMKISSHTESRSHEHNYQDNRPDIHSFKVIRRNGDIAELHHQAVSLKDNEQSQQNIEHEQNLRLPFLHTSKNFSQSRSHSNIVSHSSNTAGSETKINMVKYPVQSNSSPCILGIHGLKHAVSDHPGHQQKRPLNLKTPLSSPMKRKIYPCSELPTKSYNDDEMVNLSFVE